MGTKKGRTHFGDTIINKVLEMVEEGKTYREISEFFGFENKIVIRNLLYKHRKNERHLIEGAQLRKKGRPSKYAVSTAADKDSEIKRLKMENELLKTFLQIVGRR